MHRAWVVVGPVDPILRQGRVERVQVLGFGHKLDPQNAGIVEPTVAEQRALAEVPVARIRPASGAVSESLRVLDSVRSGRCMPASRGPDHQ